MTPRIPPWLHALFALLLCLPAAARALEPVSLELRRYHPSQFAGYYAALEKGFYQEVGLDVTLREGGPGAIPVQGVLNGSSDFGIALFHGESSAETVLRCADQAMYAAKEGGRNRCVTGSGLG